MINVNDLKNGMVIEYDGQLCEILEFMHVLQNKVAYVRVKMRNLRTGARIETALKGSDTKFKLCFIERREMQYIYPTQDSYAFMDNETYEQIEIPMQNLSWEKNFLTEGMNCDLLFYGQEVLTIELPDKVTLDITECDPAIKGDNTSRKKAVTSTGLVITVPVFLSVGDKVIVSTADGSYVSRA